MNGGESEVFEASGMLLGLWDVNPLAAWELVEVEGLAEGMGLEVRRATLSRRVPSMLMPVGGGRYAVVLDPRCTPDAQAYYLLVELCAWVSGATEHTDAHRMAAAVCMLPALGPAGLQRALADDDPVLAFNRLPALMRRGVYARHDAARRFDAEQCIARAAEARAGGKSALAVGWYARVHTAARATADLRARAFGGAGVVLRDAGRLQESVDVLHRGLQHCAEKGLTVQAAMHWHDLYSVYYSLGQFDQAEDAATRAADLYPAGHPRLETLASDVSVLWNDQGFFMRSLRVCEQVARTTVHLPTKAAASANAARAAAGLGLISRFIEHAVGAKNSNPAMSETHVPGQVLATLAEGAVAVGMWDLACSLIDDCRGVVEGSGNVLIGRQVEAVAADIESRGDRLARKLVESVRAA